MAQNPNVAVPSGLKTGITIPVDSVKKFLKVYGKHFEPKMFLNDLQNKLHSHAIPRYFISEYDTPSSSSSISRKLDLCSTVDNNILNAPAECETTIVSSLHKTLYITNIPHSLALEIFSSSVAVQTLKSWSDDTPRKQSLKSKYKLEKKARIEAQKTIATLIQKLVDINNEENYMQQCEKFLSPSLLTIVKSHIRCQKKRPNGYRYSDELKQFALTIYFLGPAVYRFSRPTLCLPVPRTLRRVMSKYELNPGLNDFLFKFLKKDKIIGFHQTNLTKTFDPAKFAFVLIICGINVQWKQPIAYFLVSGSCTGNDLHNIIMSTISKLQNISLNVKAFITDQGSNFLNFSKKVFVIYMFDPPHLLKSTRNMFFKHNFIDGENYIDNKHLIHFYNEDSKLNIRTAPKLTHAHIYPGPFEKMRVYLAAQVFSHTVITYQSLGILSFDSLRTIKFIEKMNNMFDIFNSSKTPNIVTKNNGADVTNRMNFINGWLISINGLLLLWSNMNPTNDCNFVLYTSCLNTDCLKNLFGMFRLQNGNNLNPIPVKFYCTFKKLFCLNYFKHSPNANFLNDLDSILSHLNVEETGNCNTSVILPKQTANPINFIPYLIIEDIDYRDLNIPESNALNYICGYLYIKCLKKHTCDECIKYEHIPQNDFHDFIFELENIFIEQFPILAVDKNVGIKMKDAFFNVPFNHPCPYFDHAFLIKLYVIFRIFSSLKFLNRELLTERNRKNRKVTILK
ncbi:hypothetical protein QTP88_020061 [Uroleucon formosanum]